MSHTTNICPADQAVPKLAERWSQAEVNFLASLISRPPESIDRRADRVIFVRETTEVLAVYQWASERNRLIFNAIARFAERSEFPTAEAIQADLSRTGAVEAADFVHAIRFNFPGDSAMEHWFNQAMELGRTAALYSAADRVKLAIDSGQTVSDAAPLIADVVAAAEPVEPSPTILDIAVNAIDQLSDPEPMAEPVITGGLRRGEIGLWTGATKTAKSWSILHWHCAIAAGVPCFGYGCRRGNGLLIDGELARPTIFHRLRKVADQYEGIDLSGLKIVPLRENPVDIDGLLRLLRDVQPGQFDFITIDPIFKLLPADADENNNAFIASFFTKLIVAATRLDCSILCVHHQSKGNQAGKSVADLGSGAGAQSRAVDWHCGLREHAEAGCVSLHTICRSFPPTDPSVWDLKPPTMAQRFELDPDDLKSPKPRKSKTAEPKPEKAPKPNWETISKVAGEDPRDAAYFAAELNLGERKAVELLRQSVAKQRLYLWPRQGRKEPNRWATIPAPLIKRE